MKFLPKASDVGLLNGLATGIRKLYLASFIALLVVTVYGAAVDHYINEVSQSIYLNQGLIAGHFILLFPAGWLLAMAVSSTLYGDVWRESFLLGRRFSDEEMEERPELFIDRTLSFYALFGIGVLLSYGVTMAANQSYIPRYNAEGYFETMLRSPDESERVRAIRLLMDPLHRANFREARGSDLREALVDALSDESESVRAWAAWSVGHHGVIEARPELLALLESEAGDARNEAAVALGRLADAEGERRMIALLPASLGDESFAKALFTGLGEMRSRGAAEVIGPLVSTVSDELRVSALWALARGGDLQFASLVYEGWQRSEGSERCPWAEALKALSTVEQDRALRLHFETGADSLRCEGAGWPERSYSDEEEMPSIQWIVPEELRRKYLIAIFNIGDRGLMEWLQQLAWNPDEELEMKLFADRLYSALEEGAYRPPREDRQN